MNPRVFPFFKRSFVEKYSKKLLIHPSKAIPVVTPGSKNSSLNVSRDNGPGGKGKKQQQKTGPLVAPTQSRLNVPYQCFDCGFVHELSKHSDEGLRKIKARYAAKLVAKPGVCHHCGTLGHFSRSCHQKIDAPITKLIAAPVTKPTAAPAATNKSHASEFMVDVLPAKRSRDAISTAKPCGVIKSHHPAFSSETPVNAAKRRQSFATFDERY
jgi:hypothetical protein